MGFMSGFFGSASTSFAEETARQRQLAMEQQRIDINEMQMALANRTFDVNQVQNYYDRAIGNWSNMTSKERLASRNSLQALSTESNEPSIQAYLGLMDSQIRDSMGPREARAYLATLVTEPLDPDNPYGAIPRWMVQEAIDILKASGDPDAEQIIADVDEHLAGRAIDASKITENYWATRSLEVERLQAEVSESVSRTALNNANAVKASIENKYFDEIMQEELRRMINANELNEATFESTVRQAAASAGIAESQYRVLLATESMDIAIKQGQVDQIPFLLEQLRLSNENLEASTKKILLDNEITDASKAALIAHNHNTARISGSEANMAAIREGQYSQELAANLARTLATVTLTERQAVGQGIANDLAVATFNDEVRRHAAQADITESDARVAVATETGRIQAVDLANVLTRANVTALDLNNLFASRTLNDRIATVAATRGLTESQARVAIATEADTIEAAALALEATRAQIDMWQSSTEMTREQKDQIGRAFIKDLVSGGQPELLTLFAEELLTPLFGENWQEVSEEIMQAAEGAKTESAAQHNADIALRQAQTRLAASSADLNVAELMARNTDPVVSREEIFRMVNSVMGYPSMRDIQSSVDDLGSLEASILDAEVLYDQVRMGNLDFANLGSLEPLLNELGLTSQDPMTISEVPPQAILFAIESLQTRANTQRDSIARNLGAYAYNLERNGHSVNYADLGLNPTNVRHAELWNHLRSTFPSSYLPDLEASSFFDTVNPAVVPGLLEAAAAVGTRFASSTAVVNGVVTDPASIDLIVDALKQEYDSRNGMGAWDSLEIFEDSRRIFQSIIEPEFDAYNSIATRVLNSAPLLQGLNIDVNLDDPNSMQEAMSQIDQRLRFLTTTPSGGVSFRDRVSQANILAQREGTTFNLLNPLAPVMDREREVGLVRDFVRNFLGGDDSAIFALGIAEPKDLFGNQGTYTNVDLGRLLEVIDDAIVRLNDTSNDIFVLTTRY